MHRGARALVVAPCFRNVTLRARGATEAEVGAGDELADLAIASDKDRATLSVVRAGRRVVVEAELLVREIVERPADIGMVGAELWLLDREALLEHRLGLGKLELFAEDRADGTIGGREIEASAAVAGRARDEDRDHGLVSRDRFGAAAECLQRI